MDLLQKDEIILSITKQLNLQDKVIISNIKDIINDINIINYESVKLLSKSIKEYLINNYIVVKHTQILNILSKALGYQNHHSLKSNLENMMNDKIKIDIENDSTLKKLFLIRKDFINKFEIDEWYVTGMGMEFSFLYNKYNAGLKSKKKIEINKYLKSYDFKLYKNTIPICKIKYNNIQKVAFNILQHYQSFFYPTWHEEDSSLDKYSLLLNNWYMLSYTDIKYINVFLVVDSYSTDIHRTIVNNFLDYIFTFGTLEDIEFFEKCLVQKDYSKYTRTTKTLAEFSRIYSWKKQQLLKLITKNKKYTINDTLDEIRYEFNIEKYMLPYMMEFEDSENKAIKNIIIENCGYFYNLKRKYTIDDIKNKLSIDLLYKEKNQYISDMKEIDNIEQYKIYQDKYNCIKHIALEIEYLIDIFNNVAKNYDKYYRISKTRGVLLS